MTSPPAMPDLGELPRALHEQLLGLSWRRTLAAGETLFLKGGAADMLIGVVSGRLRAAAVGASGRQGVVAVLRPGQWFGEISLLLQDERRYDVSAVTPTELVCVAASDFHRLVQQDPAVLMAFTRVVCLRLRAALAWVDAVLLEPLPMRLAQLLCDEATRGRALPGGEGWELEVSQDDLAAMLGVARQSVNRLLRDWAAQHHVELRYGRIRVADPAGLREAVGRNGG